MEQPAGPPMISHPLMADRARLDKIIDNMSAQIQKVLYGVRVSRRTERALHGGASADDVLQEALIALLEYDPARLRTTWEALSVRIARNKAVTALRCATRGRRTADSGADEPDDVTVVPLETMPTDPRDECADRDPGQEFERTQQQLVLLRLARQLPDRERAVVLGVHFAGRTRTELAAEIGLTPQAIGQMYVRVLKALYAKACADPAFPTTAAAGKEEK